MVHEYLEILPRLKPGVLVHVHDIFLPADYPRDAVLNRLWFWSEQYLLQAFLTFNPKFEVLWASSAMLFEYPSELEDCFPHWRNSYINTPESKRRFVPTPDGGTRLAIKLLDGPTIGISESTPALIPRKFFNTPVENCVEKKGSS